MTNPTSTAQAEPWQIWCDTCEGSGTVYQEHQAGCNVGGDHKCPDCDGKGFFVKMLATLPSEPADVGSAQRGEPSELKDCRCGNSYLAIRTDLYKDKREFVYCDCCGALADRETWQAAIPAPQQAAEVLTDGETFSQWLAREMPAGTVIGDPAWWAPRILRAALATRQAGTVGEPK